jgi:hypothetical protein
MYLITKADMDYSSLFEISLNRLEGTTKEKVYELLLPLYRKKKSIEDEFIERKHKIDYDTKIRFREEVMNKQIRNIKNKYEAEKELLMTEETISSAKRLTKEQPNEFKGFKIIKTSDNLGKRPSLKPRPATAQVYSRIRSASKFIKNNNLTINTDSKPDAYRNRTSLYLTTGSTFVGDSPSISERPKLSTRVNSSYGYRFLKSGTIRDNKIPLFTQQTISDNNNTQGNEKEIPLRKKMRSSNFKFFKNFFSKIIKDMDAKPSKDSKVILPSKIKNTINEWKKITNKKTIQYSTGSIVLPLYTQLK